MFTKLFYYILINIISLSVITAQLEKDSFEITFISNSGFLLKSENHKFLLDGIYSVGNGIFTVPSDDILNKERNSMSPFDSIKLLLVSHYHSDHINPDYVIDHMITDSSAVLVSTAQVKSLLENKQYYDLVKNNIHSIVPISGKKTDTTINDVYINIMSLRHNNDSKNEHQNLGFIINTNKFRIFHPGDAQADNPDDFKNLNLAEDSIDIAFLPYWFFDSEKKGKEIIEYLNPKAIIIIHIRINQSDTYKAKVNSMTGIPQVYFMDSTLQKINFRKDHGELSVVTSVKINSNLPLKIYLSQNYPNPFNPMTTIEYSMPEYGFVNLEIYNVLGSKISTVVNDFKNPGYYKCNFDGSNLASGIYYYQIKTNRFVKTGRMILMK